jgi:hypothetical protein
MPLCPEEYVLSHYKVKLPTARHECSWWSESEALRVRPDWKVSEQQKKKERTYVLLSKWPYRSECVSDFAECASDIALQYSLFYFLSDVARHEIVVPALRMRRSSSTTVGGMLLTIDQQHTGQAGACRSLPSLARLSHVARSLFSLAVPLLIINLGTRWGWVVSITPRQRFPPGKVPPVPIEQEAGWAPEPF